MKSQQEETEEVSPTNANADIEYIIDMFNNEELNLTITEDTEENQRCSFAMHKRQEEGISPREEEVSDSKYRSIFLSFIKNSRSQAVVFIDGAIRFMNSIKKIKKEELLQQLSSQDTMKEVMTSLITPELLIQPIEEILAYEDLSQGDEQRYRKVLLLLKGPKQLSPASRVQIQTLLGQISKN